MKYAILSHECPPALGGAGTVAFEYFKNLTSMGVDVTFFTNSVSKEYIYNQTFSHKVIEGTEVLNPTIIAYFSYYKKIHSSLNKYDRLIINDLFFSIYASVFFDNELLKKTVFMVHGSESQAIKNKKGFLGKLSRLEYRYIRALQSSRFVVCVSDFVAKRHVSDLGLGTKNIKVVNNGISCNDFYNKLSLDKKSNIAKTRFVTCSRIVEKKGYQTMLKLFAQFNKLYPLSTWTIIGDGDYLERFSQDVSVSDCAKSVILKGHVAREDIRGIYKDMDIFLLLSDFDEAHPLSYMEAAAAGLPSIGWNKGGVVDSIIYDKTGYYIDSGDEFFKTVDRCLTLLQGEIQTHSLEFDISKATSRLIDVLE